MQRRKLSRQEANTLGANRIKAIRGLRDAENQQPWRCVVCNMAVRKGYNQPCRCTGALDKERHEFRGT